MGVPLDESASNAEGSTAYLVLPNQHSVDASGQVGYLPGDRILGSHTFTLSTHSATARIARRVGPECAELGSRAAMSHANNHRVDSPRSQQRPNVVNVAGKNPVLVVHQQRHVSVNKVSCLVRS